jgi:cytidylate kinase
VGVITISRKMGSSGSYIGKEVAKRLGLKYVDKKILSKIMTDYGFVGFETVYNEVPGFWEKFYQERNRTVDFLIRTIEAVGRLDDVVIVGRGGFGIFEGYSDVLNLRIKAPLCLRVQRQMLEHGMTQEEASAHVRQNDRVRRSFIESDFQMAYTNTQDFDLVLDTGVITPKCAVEWLCEAYTMNRDQQRCGNEKSVKTLQVDPVLFAHVQHMTDSMTAGT